MGFEPSLAAAARPTGPRSVRRLPSRTPWGLAAFPLLFALAACGGAATPTPHAPETEQIVPDAIAPEAFGPRLAERLGQRTPSPSLTAGLVRRQLERAAVSFARRQNAEGLQATTGALWLMEDDRALPHLAAAAPTLVLAGDEAARQGDAGRAWALYDLAVAAAPDSPAAREAAAHLEALRAHALPSAGAPKVLRLGEAQLIATRRSLLDPRDARREEAIEATAAWVDAVMAGNYGERQVETPQDRDEVLEAYRAIRTGSASVAAVELRRGQARRARQLVDLESFRRVTPKELATQLERAATTETGEPWGILYQSYAQGQEDTRDPVAMDPIVAAGAAWGCALRLAQSAPKNPKALSPLLQLLPPYGLSPAVPSLLTPVMETAKSPEDFRFAIAITMSAIGAEHQAGRMEAARAVYDASASWLARADKQPGLGTASDKFRLFMALTELNEGELKRALPLLRQATKKGARPEEYELLTSVERQLGNWREAADAAEGRITAAEQRGDLETVASAQLDLYEILRTSPQPDAAREPLDAAAKLVSQARKAAASGAMTGDWERLYGRVLEKYGQLDAARAASHRALDKSTGNPREVSGTLIDLARRGLAWEDLATSRDAVALALEYQIPGEDLVYVTLWLQLLEKRLGLTPDGTVQRALAAVQDDTPWVQALRRWGEGLMSDEELPQVARSFDERSEAAFYVAMRSSVRGSADDRSMLERLGKSGAIRLVETSIARDLWSRQAAPPPVAPSFE